MTFKKVKKKSAGEKAESSARRDFYDPERGIHRLIPCLFLAVAVLTGFFLVLELTGANESALGRGIVWLLSGLFSRAMYAVPFLLLWQGFRWHSDVKRRRAVSRIVYYLLFLTMAGAIFFCFSGEREIPFSIISYFNNGRALEGAGLLGALMGALLWRLTGYIGVPFVTAVLVLLFFCHFLGLTPHAILERSRARKQAKAEAEAAEREAQEAAAQEEATVAAENSADSAPAAPSDPDGGEPLSAEAKAELRELHENEQKETESNQVPMTKKELKEVRKAAKRAAKEDARRRRAEENGYFPSDNDESFEELRRRFDEEALRIERESIGTAVRTPEETENAAVDSFDIPQPATAPAPSAPVNDFDFAPAANAAGDGSALRADAAFSSFDPLAAGAVINSAPTVLRPDASQEAIRRETLQPLRPDLKTEKEKFRTIPGGVQGEGDAVGSFCIRAKHMDIPSTRNPHPAGAAPTENKQEDHPTADVAAGAPLSAFEQMTRRTEEENSKNTLPYVHPATQPSTQTPPAQEPAVQAPTPAAQQPYYQSPYPPYPQAPYGQPYAPVGSYPQNGQPPYAPPAGQGAPYGVNPYAQQPYAPYPWGQQMPQGTPAQGVGGNVPPIQPQYSSIPQQPAPEQAPPKAAESILATEHVADHPLREQHIAPQTPAAPARQASSTPAPSYDNHIFPPLSLLTRSVPITNANSQAEIDEMSERLVGEFRKFKHNVEVREVTIGPRITRYCISPPDGVRINTLIGLANDIALGLAVKSIRINPVPDTPYLGVEIPNRVPTTVRLSSLVDTEEFRHTKTVTTVPLGANITGAPVFADIAKMPHVLIAGATGMGKSVLINSILLSLLYKARPDEVKLILVDPKRVEMSVYNGIPHLLIPPVVEPQKAAGALIWAVGEMERRYHLMESVGTRSIEGYNEAVKRDPSRGEKQPKIIIVIDELNDLMMQARDAVEPAIMSIAQKARAAGIHLIIGTQRPSVDVITGVIKANIPSRIALHVSSGTDSRTILDTYGAEKLLDKGDMLAVISGAEAIRVQSAFVSDEEVENVTAFLRQNAGPAVYDEIISAQIESETEKYKNSGKRAERSDDDEDMDGSIFEDSQFMQACNVALESGKISTSLLQRRCSIGYGKAAKYIDTMETIGLVSAPDGQKPREVLMSRDQFMEMVSRETYTGD